jgi:hypothetical protein
MIKYVVVAHEYYELAARHIYNMPEVRVVAKINWVQMKLDIKFRIFFKGIDFFYNQLPLGAVVFTDYNFQIVIARHINTLKKSYKFARAIIARYTDRNKRSHSFRFKAMVMVSLGCH